MSAQDERVRDTHAALNGIVLPADSPFWDRHTPPWEYGCRCDVRGITAEEADELREADADKDPEKRRVLDGAVKDRLERESRLERGVNEIFDVRTPTERGETGPDWSSKDLTIPIDVLRSRYDADVWKKFTDWAGETEVEGLGTVWQWLIGEASVSAPASQPGKAALAALLIRHRSNFPPVGGAFMDKSGETVRHAEAVAKVIDEMHGDGQLPPISLNAPPDPDAFGYFERHPSLATARLWVDGKGLSPRLTAAHEIGHALDWYGFGNGGSVSASTTLAEFSGWRQAVQASDAIAKIATAPLPVKTRDYLLRPREIWARSYAQWVAVRSGNPALRSELQLELRKFGGIGIQWESSDFDPIAAEIDQLFGALGWLRPTQP